MSGYHYRLIISTIDRQVIRLLNGGSLGIDLVAIFVQRLAVDVGHKLALLTRQKLY